MSVALLLLTSATNVDRGMDQFAQGQFAKAASIFRAALKASPRNESARLHLARALIHLNRIPEALEVLQPLTLPSASAEARLEAGRTLRHLAERRFRTLQRVAAGTPATMEILGRRLEREGNFAGALEQFEAVRKLEPARPGIHYSLGSVLWKLRELPRAETELRAELATQPGHSMANLRLGQLLVQTEREAEAIPHLEAARTALPHLIEISRELGKAYRKVGRLNDARSAWEFVVSSRPGDDQVHYLLAGLYRELGEPEKATRELQEHRKVLEGRRQRR
ncbi:MAG TPA: tetratricopeptide repeat protein [Bryobacteraceae bacterium]|nr:tetratricopeptide repeat protein [Bryobacteraceae bacterium]